MSAQKLFARLLVCGQEHSPVLTCESVLQVSEEKDLSKQNCVCVCGGVRGWFANVFQALKHTYTRHTTLVCAVYVRVLVIHRKEHQ